MVENAQEVSSEDGKSEPMDVQIMSCLFGVCVRCLHWDT
jgi:hypothetical protein